MRNSLILTLIGPDKPGLVEMLSATLSRMKPIGDRAACRAWRESLQVF
jgi:hypothetical protein